MNKQREKSLRALLEMFLLSFISVPRVLKIMSRLQKFLLISGEKMPQHIKKPLAFSHSLL